MKHDFLIHSEILEKLRARFENAAAEIKKAVSESRPLIIRHHADCDGYSGAIALERNIMPLLAEKHSRPGWEYIYYKRSPMQTPYYDYSDANRDLSFALRDKVKFGAKMPLIILIDNGSTEEDLMALKKMRIYGVKVIVVDHHFTSEGIVDDFVDVHINPYLAGGNNNLTSGMLCVELSKFLDNFSYGSDFLAALSGVGDRATGNEFEQYLKIAETQGYPLDILKELAEALDFEALTLGALEGRELIDDLLGNDKAKQKKVLEIIHDDVDAKKKNILKGTLHSIKKKEINHVLVIELDVLKVNFRGGFPAVGKTVGMVFDYFKDKNPTVVLGYGDCAVTIRTNAGKFTVQELLGFLKEKVDYAYVHGGGHENAGTIKFLEFAREKIIKTIDEFLTIKLK